MANEPIEEIVLEYALLDLLADPESAMVIYKERITPDMMIVHFDRHGNPKGGERRGYLVLQWVHEFIDQYGVAPTAGVVAKEFDEIQFDTTDVPVDYVVQRIRSRFRQKQLQDVVGKVAEHVHHSEPDQALEYGLHELSQIYAKTVSRKNAIDVAEEWQQQYEAYREDILTGRLQGVSWGWKKIDESIGGMIPGFYVMAGRTGKGKTWALLKSAIENARDGKRVTLHTLEMGLREVNERVMCMIANVSYWRYVQGYLEPEDHARLREAMAEWHEQGNKLTLLQPAVADRTVPGLIEVSKPYEPDLVIVDQFQFIRTARGRVNDADHKLAEYICEDVKLQSENVQLPIYIAAQINRSGAQKEAGGGDIEHIAQSDAIPRFADAVLRVHQNKDMVANHFIEIAALKTRRARINAWYLKMNLYDECNITFIGEKDDEDTE